jgi:hypothetical protein
MGEGFGLFKKAIRPFGNAERNTPRRKKKKKKLSRNISELVSGKLGVFGDLGL